MDEIAYPTLISVPAELRGDLVVLRPYRLEDARALHESVAESRDHLRPWVSWVGRHDTLEGTHDFVRYKMARWLLREDLFYAVWEAQSGQHLGECGLHHIDWRLRRFAVGYWLRSSAEGHGYITQAVHLLTDCAFNVLRANRVELFCDALNTRSATVAERVGFKREGLLRNDSLARDGTLRDSLLFSLVPADRR